MQERVRNCYLLLGSDSFVWEIFPFNALHVFCRSMMSDSPTSWADCFEMPPDVCTITTDPTSEQDRALVNNLRMTDSRVAAGNSVAFLASVAASTPVPHPSQNAPLVRGSFRPCRPEYLTRFERTHFVVHNVTPERPCSAVFNL